LHLDTPTDHKQQTDKHRVYQHLTQCDIDGVITDYSDFWLGMAER